MRSRPTRVLVDGTHLLADAKGVGLYTYNVLEEISRLDPDLELWILTLADRPVLELPDGKALHRETFHRVAIPWRNHFWHGFWTLPRQLAAIRPEVIWIPYEAPLARLRVPYVMVCHDVPGELRRAQELGGAQRPWVHQLRDRLDDQLIRRAVRGAFRVFSNSRYVAEHLTVAQGVEADKIHLAPCAPGADFAGLSRRVDVAAVRSRLDLEDGYVLTFFTGDLRENPEAVPAVYDRLVAAGAEEGLVVAGVKPDDRADVERRYSEQPWFSRIRFLPFYGSDRLFELVEVYTAASVYLDPSLQEGFGMQVIEAMACRTPVVCSDRGALPEVTAGAALLADPLDAEALAAQTLKVLSEPSSRDRLIRRGEERAGQFTWQRTARVILEGLLDATRSESS